MDVESVASLQSLTTYITVIEKHPWEMNRFQMIFHFRWELGFESVTEGTSVFLDRRIYYHILAEIICVSGT